MSRGIRALVALLFFAGLTAAAQQPKSAAVTSAPELDAGFHLLYELKFPEARERFADWKKSHPEQPLGDVSIAASYLFEEFSRQGVLTSEFFLNDKKFLHGIEGKPDEARKKGFQEANHRARETALRRLKADPNNADALFALTLVAGMQADYLSVLERRQLDSLKLIKEADAYAKRLLAVRPDAADAWLALGAANYIIGCLPRTTRFFLWFGGIHGDRNLGMEQLRKTAELGHYLRPFAKMMLALAARREKQNDLAQRLLAELTAEFPESPLYAAELARVTPQMRANPPN
jgi:hypothetical protein